MTALKITQFGGVVPRVSPRALPASAAQRYENLLATSVELRPLPGDKTVAGAVDGLAKPAVTALHSASSRLFSFALRVA